MQQLYPMHTFTLEVQYDDCTGAKPEILLLEKHKWKWLAKRRFRAGVRAITMSAAEGKLLNVALLTAGNGAQWVLRYNGKEYTRAQYFGRR